MYLAVYNVHQNDKPVELEFKQAQRGTSMLFSRPILSVWFSHGLSSIPFTSNWHIAEETSSGQLNSNMPFHNLTESAEKRFLKYFIWTGRDD
jgi:hypothetical protein